MEYYAHDVPWWGDLVTGEPTIVGGYIHLNDRPGHGDRRHLAGTYPAR
ncbi:MAG: hypothetical protein ACYC0C_01350 [Devosia sp.]